MARHFKREREEAQELRSIRRRADWLVAGTAFCVLVFLFGAMLITRLPW